MTTTIDSSASVAFKFQTLTQSFRAGEDVRDAMTAELEALQEEGTSLVAAIGKEAFDEFYSAFQTFETEYNARQAAQAVEAVRREREVAANAATRKIDQALDDLRTNGCRKVAVALNTLFAAIAEKSIDEIAGILRDLGTVHANRARLKAETVAYAEGEAEKAVSFLLWIFLEILEEARDLFQAEAQVRRQGRRLQADGLHNEAVGLIRRARGIAFGNREKGLPSAFGGAGFAALERMITADKGLPETISRRLVDDLEFAEEVAGQSEGRKGAALLNALLAPPRREHHSAPARKTMREGKTARDRSNKKNKPGDGFRQLAKKHGMTPEELRDKLPG